MPGDQQPDNTAAGYGRNGSADRAIHSRIADLLDDVTVGVPAAATPAVASATGSDRAVPPAPAADARPQQLPGFLERPTPAPLPGDSDRAAAHNSSNDTAMASAVAAAMAAGGVTSPPAAPVPASQAAASAPEVGGPPPETVPEAMPAPALSIRGRADGLAIEIGKGSWHEILAALEVRLGQSASFFRDASVALDLGARPATESELAELIGVLRANGMTLGAVRTSAERTFQSALTLGLTATLESADGVPVANAAPAATNAANTAYFVYRGYLRSGHKLQRQEHILVIGDVNPGAEVVSQGDVLVWGRLRGVVHAGAGGHQRAIVAALDLEPTQLRIADVMTIGPDPRPGQPGKWFWQRSANKRPEVARIANGTIVLEEWDASRPGGLVSLRRRG